MKTSKEIPEEVKNQIINGKKRVVTIPLPEKQKKIIEEKKAEKGKLAQKFYQVSVAITKSQKVTQDILTKMENIDKSISDRITEGFKKLKLKKQKERHWRFDGKENFIGIYNPPTKEKK